MYVRIERRSTAPRRRRRRTGDGVTQNREREMRRCSDVAGESAFAAGRIGQGTGGVVPSCGSVGRPRREGRRGSAVAGAGGGDGRRRAPERGVLT
jgi:hypothetical protein